MSKIGLKDLRFANGWDAAAKETQLSMLLEGGCLTSDSKLVVNSKMTMGQPNQKSKRP